MATIYDITIANQLHIIFFFPINHLNESVQLNNEKSEHVSKRVSLKYTNGYGCLLFICIIDI